VAVSRDLAALIDLVKEHGLENDPMIRARMADLLIGCEALRLGGMRAMTAQMKTGIPGPEGSIGKWEWATLNQSLTELACDILGPEGLERGTPWTYRMLRSRANSIEGGTTEVMKNIVAERVLGLPRLR